MQKSLIDWKYLEETQDVIKELNKHITKIERTLIDFGGISNSPDLVRRYCYTVGQIEGLNYLLKLLETKE